jgi:hypothetical protein
MRTIAIALACGTALGAQPAADLDQLFRAHEWFELRSAVTERSPALMRAAVATAFNDPATAERPSARRHPLGAGFERRGRRVRHALADLPAVRTIPSVADVVPAVGSGNSRFRASARRSRRREETAGRPDQVNGRPRHAVLGTTPGIDDSRISRRKSRRLSLRHRRWTSVMTERMAARLGLKLDATRRAITGSSGQSAGFRMAIAKEVDIGGTRFRNVSFAVIEGTGPLPSVDAGIVGMPILLALA